MAERILATHAALLLIKRDFRGFFLIRRSFSNRYNTQSRIFDSNYYGKVIKNSNIL
jgi:hypothetical protein